VLVSLPPPGAIFACEKVSKRYDQDISAVSAACLVELDNGTIRAARLAFGGMGPVAARARRAEAALQGRRWSREALDRAADALAADLAPMSDLRGTDRYRTAVAAGLLRRLWWRVEQPDVAGAYGLAS